MTTESSLQPRKKLAFNEQKQMQERNSELVLEVGDLDGRDNCSPLTNALLTPLSPVSLPQAFIFYKRLLMVLLIIKVK